MDNSRRRFLQLAIAAAAGTAIDPERLIWTPGQMIAVPQNYTVFPDFFPVWEIYWRNVDLMTPWAKKQFMERHLADIANRVYQAPGRSDGDYLILTTNDALQRG